ncbi:N-acetyltransferase [Sedimentisphaera salicampi]|uniref:Amino-acid acetyltransferase n=1 Tax=Sedimentisphaera salicampi TaxID=1941349 RepID=A0A1W6LJT7_9BACT|nr:N-acetyltransferase [Sedimentisphaera salicampi]ARN56051.1 Amino-acid acetyltransferase [Sedimentisphaera salicampi]OXU15784.1 Amino-acid acetyltransferase [Sedimentisphaera salicampi]
MTIRKAKISDAEGIHKLIRHYAELDRMLFRSLSRVYEDIMSFVVAEQEGVIAGCGALSVVSKDLAEIKSLAVNKRYAGKGLGKAIVQKHMQIASELGIKKVFALTLEEDFFLKCGFETVEKGRLPMKVWSDCANCPKQEHCDEIAVVTSVEKCPKT